jgi:hypothetical protein
MITVWNRPADQGAAGDYDLTPHVALLLAPDGTARLLDMGGGFFALSAVGARMLQGTLERGSAATVRELARHYRTGEERVRADLGRLLQQLQRQRLLRLAGKRRPDPLLWLATAVVPCLWLIRWLPAGGVRAAVVLTLAKLALVCFGWARTVAVWRFGLRGREGGPADAAGLDAMDQTVQRIAAGHPLPMACKERALACWALLRWSGVPAALVVGVELFPLTGHCWCEAGGRTWSDYADNCDSYTPVIRYN